MKHGVRADMGNGGPFPRPVHAYLGVYSLFQTQVTNSYWILFLNLMDVALVEYVELLIHGKNNSS
jgi:hypothetical protein